MSNLNPVSANQSGAIADVQHVRNSYIAITILIATSLMTIGLFGYFGFVTGDWRLFLVAALTLAAMLTDIYLITLIRRGRSNLSMMILMTNFLIVVLGAILVIKGLGIIIAVSSILIVISISSLAMPSRYALTGVLVGTIAGLALFILDTFIKYDRIAVPQLEQYSTYIIIIMGLGFLVIGVREFNRVSLRVKIALGILATGGITVAISMGFGISRSTAITNLLLEKYINVTTTSTQEHIVQTAEIESEQVNEIFAEISNDLQIIGKYRANIEEQRDTFSQGTYWDATTRLMQLPDGQYGNRSSDLASIFIPSNVGLDEDIIAELNTTAYLDFYAPDYLRSHPEVVAVYFISNRGTTTYYPNIDLAANVPPDFDPRQQSFFNVALPSNDPDRKPIWTQVYQDPAGQGLVVTLSVPVYSRGIFLGVMSADLQLERVIERISGLKIGNTGYAFLVDNSGHIIAMPPQGYVLYGLQPEIIPVGESPKNTIIGKGSSILQKASEQIVSDKPGISQINLDGQSLYVVSAPVKDPGYHLGVITPTSEFTGDINAARADAQKEITSALQGITVILIALFVGAIVISLLVGQVITAPLSRLTSAVEKISSGDLTARASINTQDETGVLASAFNSMAENLSEVLVTLEERVNERTDELQKANKTNLRRAARFEAIARLAHAISNTQELEILLPQITEIISGEFEYYHVGIFLLDTRKEYAVLVAANSEGGQRMLARSHRLLVGETGIVGYATRSGQPRIALNVGQDAAYFNNPDLPSTRSEVALPLRFGDEIIGALDVQSTEQNAFSEEDINIFSALADQVSVAIQNARTYQQMREALNQAEAASAQLSGKAWQEMSSRKMLKGFAYDGVNITTVENQSPQPATALTIPLLLRGVKIGSVNLNPSDPNRAWTDDEIAMVQAAAERTAFAIENARLLQEAQRRAAKERTIGEISSKIGSLGNIESIIQTAIKELGATLPDTDIAIQFTSNKNGSGTE